MSDNPLLVPPREAVVELWPGDVERRLFDLETALDEAEGKAEEWAAGRAAGAGRASDAASHNPHLAEADKAAEQIDALTRDTKPTRLVLRAPLAQDVRRVRDEHTPRKGNAEDEATGVNNETFYQALGAKAIVEPEVTPEQWAEFCESVTELHWRKVVRALDDLCLRDVDLPKSSAVSALTELRRRRSQRLPGSG